MGTKLLLGFGGTVNQAVVHHPRAHEASGCGFGGTVNQAVVHLDAEDVGVEGGFGGTVN